MTPERYQLIGQLFDEALERAPEERAAWLEQACGADAELRAEVEKLLANHVGSEGFLSRPAMQVAAQLFAQKQSASLAGQTINHYQIHSLLGAGGMGEVWLARDNRLERQVALKLLPEQFTRDEDRVHRFVQEAKAASALNHPNIITIHEIGIEGGAHYIATEFIDGQTLRQHLKDDRLALSAALDIAVQTTAALAAAHEASIVHRDIKPENVMVRRDGIVKVLDFGLAKLTEQHPDTVDTEAATIAKVNTAPGTVMGTARYMSPEQARGQEVDARSDIFSLGVLLYEMVAGQAPFAGVNTLEVISEILKAEPAALSLSAPTPAEVPPAELQRIVSKALRKNRDERYPTAKELLADLKELKRELDFVAEERRRSSSVGSVGSVGGAIHTAAVSEQRLAQSATSGLQPAPAEASEGVDIAHVLFCDIVGYSILPIDRQKRMISALQEIVRQTEDYRRSDSRGQLVRLPAGDGMALAFLQDPVAPARCAFEIARALQSQPEIRLRMGIHSGPVFLSTDINGTRNVVGSGINMAQRVMDSGDAGHILVSRNVAEVLGQVSYWKPLLHDLGEREVKHGVQIHLYNLCTGEVGNSEAPSKLRTGDSTGVKGPSKLSPEIAQKAVVADVLSLHRPVAPSPGHTARHTVGREDESSMSFTPPGRAATPPERKAPARRRWLVSALLGVLLLAGVGLWWPFSATKQIESIAVLPFVNASGNADVEYLSDGMTETLIGSLSQLPNLNVKARSSVFRYKGKEIDLQKIAQELKVQAILTGRVAQRGDQLTLSLELVNAQTENAIWSEQYNRKQTDLVSLQSEIARDVSSKLKTKLSGADEQKVAKTYTADPAAYQLYLKGRFYWNKRTSDALKQAVEFYKQAIERDPNYALAYSGLAESYVLFPDYSVALPQDSMPKARAAAIRALEMDDSLAEAHAALGLYHSSYSWNQPAAEKEFRRAIELKPNYPTTHHWLGNGPLSLMGRFDESIAEGRRADLAHLVRLGRG